MRIAHNIVRVHIPLLGTVFSLGAIGCAQDLPIAERIASVRPLAIRTTVVEDPVPDPARTETLPLETIIIEPWLVDTEAPLSVDEIAAMEPVWLACTLQSTEGVGSCLANALPLVPDDVPLCPTNPVSVTSNPPSPCRIETDAPAQPRYTIPFDTGFMVGGDLEITMVAHAPDLGDTEECLAALLGEQGFSEACIIAAQRVSIGPDQTLLALASDFGIDLPIDAPPAADPDTHPRIQTFTAEIFENGESTGAPIALERGQTLSVKRDQILNLETTALESDLQTYPIPNGDGYEDYTEDFDGQWFVTWGELLSPSSDDPVSTNDWTLSKGEQDETELPPANAATLYYVLRDGRQGVDWWWFYLQFDAE